ncbi:ABC transporter ATP-binding protein [Glycomyces sp. L485]|uniref:ATP-binding cassette domain-containing protein n=1 Tax=Glycomyces sp. L485 TaxID=2909235 RepID=UPI001F4AC346|nr:ABC transporter ATP-binding protein [Glycomyces sp. L485]MCH7231869.1 ABC transporter ATP-binding protein [Glycomyces sp. L485]
MNERPDEHEPPIYIPGGYDDVPAVDRTVFLGRAESAAPAFLVADRISAAGHQGPVFSEISVSAELGQVVAVTGDGGDGRTSLLLALAGRFALTGGALTVEGQTRLREIRRRFTVAEAPPAIGFDEYHTVAECIKETVTVSGRTATRANIHAWLDRLAVTVDTGDTFGFLPRIEQVRFAIACAAASRTPAIVVDDADTGLNYTGGERVFETLRTVADAGQLVIAACTSHDAPADAVVELRAGHTARRLRRGGNRIGGLI